MRASHIVVGIMIVAALITGWRFFFMEEAQPSVLKQAPEKADSASAEAIHAIRQQQTADERLAQIAEALRSKYADRIHRADWQIKVLGHLMALLQEMYPHSWHEAMRTVLHMAFPEWADALMARLADWLDYQNWLEQVFSVMAFSGPDDRYDTLWAKRVSLFGDDAYIIWAEEQKQRAFVKAVHELDQQQGSVSEKARRYVGLVRETWGEQAFGNDGRNTTQIMGEFVKLDSVQVQLRDMSPAEQDNILRQFRQDMGLDDEAIERWQKLDEERREQRSVGEIYMNNRAALLQELQGESQQQAIHNLQVELFGEEEARYIRNEEASGVFRFQSEQIIGVN